MSGSDAPQYVLPSVLITKADLSRLIREVENVDNELEAQKARSRAAGKKEEYHMPGISQALNDFVELNKLDFADDQVRMRLKKELKTLKNKAPVIHMTFAVEADIASLRQLTEYIRKEIHPQAFLRTGLQPALVGGVYMRTPNHAHDFSIRAKLAGSRGVIQQDLDQMMHAIPVVEAPMFPPEPKEQA